MSGLGDPTGPGGTGWDDNSTNDFQSPSIEAFHRALEAALRCRVTLDLGQIVVEKDRQSADSVASIRSRHKVPTGRLTERKLQTLRSLSQIHPAQQVALQSSRERTGPTGQATDPERLLGSQFGEIAGALPQKYVSGFTVYCLTGRSDLVLDAMSVNQRSERELSRVTRPSLVYLLVLVLVGTVGAIFVGITLITVDHLREDLLLSPRGLATESGVIPWISQSQFSMLPWLGLLLISIFLLALLRPVSAGIAKCVGGLGYLIAQRQALAARVEHALVESGVDAGQAEQQVSRLIGFQPKRKRPPRTVSRGDQSPSDIQRLRLEARHFQTHSNNRLRQLRIGLPMLLVVTIGSVGVLLYCLALFIPLTTLLYELAAPPIDPVYGRSIR